MIRFANPSTGAAAGAAPLSPAQISEALDTIEAAGDSLLADVIRSLIAENVALLLRVRRLEEWAAGGDA